MPFPHAVAYIDRHAAKVVQFDSESSEIKRLSEHTVNTRQHNSGVRTEHEFFAEVCTALANISSVLVVGSHLSQAAFKHYVEAHRPALSRQIIGWETVDHPTDGELIALARDYVAGHERGAESPPVSA